MHKSMKRDQWQANRDSFHQKETRENNRQFTSQTRRSQREVCFLDVKEGRLTTERRRGHWYHHPMQRKTWEVVSSTGNIITKGVLETTVSFKSQSTTHNMFLNNLVSLQPRTQRPRHGFHLKMHQKRLGEKDEHRDLSSKTSCWPLSCQYLASWQF